MQEFELFFYGICNYKILLKGLNREISFQFFIKYTYTHFNPPTGNYYKTFRNFYKKNNKYNCKNFVFFIKKHFRKINNVKNDHIYIYYIKTLNVCMKWLVS